MPASNENQQASDDQKLNAFNERCSQNGIRIGGTPSAGSSSGSGSSGSSRPSRAADLSNGGFSRAEIRAGKQRAETPIEDEDPETYFRYAPRREPDAFKASLGNSARHLLHFVDFSTLTCLPKKQFHFSHPQAPKSYLEQLREGTLWYEYEIVRIEILLWPKEGEWKEWGERLLEEMEEVEEVEEEEI